MQVVLISTYELGHQPFGLASPAAWLRAAGVTVRCMDLAVQPLREEEVACAEMVAFYVPMHTATRLATSVVERVKQINPSAHICFYGLYAPGNAEFLRKVGADTILGGEFEEGLVSVAKRLSAATKSAHDAPQPEPVISLAKQLFLTPDRSGLAHPSQYAHITLADGTKRAVGYTEASRGCKHTCRHCPIVPIYEGRFRIVQLDIVLDDIRQQLEQGAEHITFGDPDFFNGPGHSIPLVRKLHERWPDLTYDVTIKVEHLLKRARDLPILRDTGCVLVTTAVESLDDSVLQLLNKGHTRNDFFRLVSLLRRTGLALNPTFVTFTPWTSPAGFFDLLTVLVETDLVGNVSPIQYAIRLLVPGGSKLLELPEIHQFLEPFDQEALSYPWTHPDPAVDRLYENVLRVVKRGQARNESRGSIFNAVWQTACDALQSAAIRQLALSRAIDVPDRAAIPWLSEPWFC